MFIGSKYRFIYPYYVTIKIFVKILLEKFLKCYYILAMKLKANFHNK
jgi:hypothetical protein